jgi:hypothetical protein
MAVPSVACGRAPVPEADPHAGCPRADGEAEAIPCAARANVAGAPRASHYDPIVIMRHADGNVVSLMECPHCEIYEEHGLARPDDEKTFQCRWCLARFKDSD